MSRVIRIDAEVFAWLQGHANPLRDNPNSVLRRIAGLPPREPSPQAACRAMGEPGRAAKLTPEQVIEMRDRYRKGGISMSALGREYGVGSSNAFLAIRGKTWTHLPGAVLE